MSEHLEYVVRSGDPELVLARAALFSWDETARRTIAVYREVLGLA